MPNNSGMEIVLLVEVVTLVVVALFAILFLRMSKNRDAAEAAYETPPATGRLQRHGGGYATEDTVRSMRTRPNDWDVQ
jgi:hypothetical protein